MRFHRAGQMHFGLGDQKAADLGQVPGALPADLFVFAVQGQFDESIVPEHPAELNPTGWVCSEPATQYLAFVAGGETFGLQCDFCTLRVGVRGAAPATIKTYSQIGVICRPAVGDVEGELLEFLRSVFFRQSRLPLTCRCDKVRERQPFSYRGP